MKKKEKHNYSVYMHTNKLNGKKYIGITKQNPERRWQNGHGYDNTYFGNAIHKYGWDGFFHEVLIYGLTEEEACSWEIALIAMHNTNQREYGYNISEGGETCDCCSVKYGEDHPNHKRVKMIDPKTGEVVRIFGAQSEAARKLEISRKGITKNCQGISATYKGYIWEYADEDYQKPTHNGVGNYRHDKLQKKIIMIEPNGEVYHYDSIKEASEDLGVRRPSISRYLNHERHDASERRWLFA